ncbi:hypothetical protein Barb4_00544 [Bacteroidales bacterium Barb4]|nr:hypothetical protein Barb4_00544 [Bacteroidales bacterium Barb4]
MFIIKIYRKLPISFRNKIYNIFLGTLINFIRCPHNPVWFYRGYKTKKKLLSLSTLFSDKAGIEIGGGTLLFSSNGFFPVYTFAEFVDGCNFSNETIWEGHIDSKSYMYSGIKLGEQFIGEAVDVASIVNKQYDFLISSNCLEHIANPLKAIKNWLSALKSNGQIMLVLPNKQSNFDHRRPYTTFSHLLEDYHANVDEKDMNHLDEILTYHDIKRDRGAGNAEQFLNRSKDNYKNRCLHHHVFSASVLIEVYKFFNLKIIYCGEDWSSIYIIGIK